jgi:hypothetical protein
MPLPLLLRRLGMARQNYNPDEMRMFGKVRAKKWMEGNPMGGGSSRLETKTKPKPKTKKKRGGTVSRKKGGKIMQGYKAGGKV